VGLNLQNTLVVVVLCIEAAMELAASYLLAGICCRLFLPITKVVAGLCTLTELVVAEAKAGGTDALVLAFGVAEALVAEADSDTLVMASGVVEALVLAPADERCLWHAAALPALLFLVRLAAAWLALSGLLPSVSS
jgi:hypothetical protein